jgi:hypothetical protein
MARAIENPPKARNMFDVVNYPTMDLRQKDSNPLDSRENLSENFQKDSPLPKEAERTKLNHQVRTLNPTNYITRKRTEILVGQAEKHSNMLFFLTYWREF